MNVLDEKPIEAQHQPTMTALDRCDRCGSQAYVKALLATGELLFCRHHFLKYESKIRPVALEIFDETWQLTD